jgi:putative transcriptional regulator
MKPIITKPSKGALLIAEPFLKDFYFRRSVVLLAEHNDDGSFGLIINKPVDVLLNDIIKDFPYFETKLFIGGPVSTESLFVMHTLGDTIENSFQIMPGLYWGGNMNVIRDMIEAKKITNDDIRFYIGYAGWNPKQLDNELKEHSWAMTKTKAQGILIEPPEDMWKNYLKDMGNEYAMWVNYPIDPILN